MVMHHLGVFGRDESLFAVRQKETTLEFITKQKEYQADYRSSLQSV
jgi:hypothetical protein